MRHSRSIRAGLALATVAVLGVPAAELLGYTTAGHVWGTNQVTFYVNPQSVWVSPSSAISALTSAADAWTQQTHANIQLVYGGTTSGSSLALNNKNEVFFRNDSSGYLAETYWWWDGSGRLVDADIVFHEGYHYYALSGCEGSGAYVEDVGIHEFGHVLGVGHSETGGSTMYPNLPSWCDTTQESLEQDDISGIESLYPAPQFPAAPTQLSVAPSAMSPSSSLVLSWLDNATNESGYQIERSLDGRSYVAVASVISNSKSFTDTGLASATRYTYRVRAVNTTGVSAYSNSVTATVAAPSLNSAPGVSIVTPYSDSSYPAGTTVSFSGTTTDAQDGSISGGLLWTSSLDGQIGTGASFSKALTSGQHTITAQVTDSGGLTGSAQVTILVGAAQTPALTLSVKAYKVKGVQRADLAWSNFTSGNVDVYRNGAKLMTTANDGAQSDAIGAKGAGSYQYKACEAGTSNCSPVVSVTF